MSDAVEIPRAEWTSYFDRFSQVHEGWLVAIEVDNPGAASGPAARDLPLEGVVADIRSGRDEIAIILDLAELPQLAHRIVHPERVEVSFTEDGADESVTFHAEDGSRTRLRFRSPVRPEVVDGVPR